MCLIQYSQISSQTALLRKIQFKEGMLVSLRYVAHLFLSMLCSKEENYSVYTFPARSGSTEIHNREFFV